MKTKTTHSLWWWPDNCLHCDPSEPLAVCEEGPFVPRWKCHCRSSHCTGKSVYSLPGSMGMSEAHICGGPWWTTNGPLKFGRPGGLCTDVLWKPVLLMYVLNAPQALWDLGPCGWEERRALQRIPGRSHGWADLSPDSWEAPVTPGRPGSLGK